MYCEPCRVERLGTARFCVICGSTLLQRPREQIEADLARVRWLLAELPEWDASLVAARPRQYVIERYRQREKVLLWALAADEPAPTAVAPPSPTPAVPHVAAAMPPPVRAPPPPVAAPSSQTAEPSRSSAEPSRSSREQSREEASRAAGPGPLLEVELEAPSLEDRVVLEASSWSRIWKPFLNQSIGWFIGAFLILSGTFYLVSDSWSGLTSTLRALVVFGLAAGWTLGFSAWAQFLWRREATRGAARVLKLIGAAMAPLAPFAVGPVAKDSPLLVTALVLAWSAVAAVLALGVTRDLQKVGLRNVPLAMAACAAMMGLAPMIVGFHGAALWLMVIPVGLLWANSRSGAGLTERTRGCSPSSLRSTWRRSSQPGCITR